jgi:hypothetical protein
METLRTRKEILGKMKEEGLFLLKVIGTKNFFLVTDKMSIIYIVEGAENIAERLNLKKKFESYQIRQK